MTTGRKQGSVLPLLHIVDHLYHPSAEDEENILVPADKTLKDRIVLLYFSASWCAPCSYFTPTLTNFYNALRDKHRTDFEIVYCSFDKSFQQYQSYTSKMPWHCIPFDQPQVTKKLAEQFQVQTIPHLVILEPDGRTEILPGEHAVEEVSLDPMGQSFPWRPKSLEQLLDGASFRHDCRQPTIPMASLDSKYLMMYFSATWCPTASRNRFTEQQLNKCYEALKQQREDFELVYVSAHEYEEDFEYVLGFVNFPFMPFDELPTRRALLRALHVRDFPTLLILSPKHPTTGKRTVINPQIGLLPPDGFVSEFPHRPKQYNCIERSPEAINHQRCLMVFLESADDDEQNEVMELLNTISAEQGIRALWALQPSEMSQTLRLLCQLGQTEPKVVLLDLPDNGSYYVMSGEEPSLSRDRIVAFLQHPGKKRALS